MAEISKRDIDIFNGMFDIDVKSLVSTVREYQALLLQQAKDSRNANVKFDKYFMSDLAKDGFLHVLKIYYDREIEWHEAEESIIKQVDDILDGD